MKFSMQILSTNFVCMCKVQSEILTLKHHNATYQRLQEMKVSPSVWLTAEVEERRKGTDLLLALRQSISFWLFCQSLEFSATKCSDS